MQKSLAVALVFLMLLSLSAVVKLVVGGSTIVEVDPSLIEYHQDATGQQFTVAVKVVDVVNLYGFDIKFRWNTTYLEYVSHSVRVPKNTYSDGVLWNPTLQVMDQVNANGTYWIAYSSYWPAPSFNGTGTVFTMTFRVKHHPVQPEPTANLVLELYSTDLADKSAGSIPHTRQNGRVTLYALSASHDIAVIGAIRSKTVVGLGYTLRVNVTVQDQGSSDETFSLSVYANTTLIETKLIAIVAGSSMTISVTWNTTGYAKGNYTTRANVTAVFGETDIEDNTLTDGRVFVSTVGDVNGDRKVNLIDVFAEALAFGSSAGQPRYQPNLDLNGDGKINLVDYFATCLNFNKPW